MCDPTHNWKCLEKIAVYVGAILPLSKKWLQHNQNGTTKFMTNGENQNDLV